MIDIGTLHIGSHVSICGKMHRVAAIDALNGQIGIDAYTTDAKGVKHPFGYNIEDIEPIPITPELLTELGFEKREIPTFPDSTTMYVDAEYAKLRAEGNRLVVPRITIQYFNITNPYWSVSAFGKNMEDNKAAVRYLHELEQFLYLATKTELIKE